MDYEQKLRNYLDKNKIKCEHLIFKQSCHSVSDAAKAANAQETDFIKSICMMHKNRLIVAIVKGEHRASTKRVAKALNIDRPRIATPDEVLQKTGYPVGGVPAFGYNAIFLIDPKVMEMKIVYAGGGSSKALTKVSAQEIQKANHGKIVRVRK
ncbi:MAG: Proline--tRNA ligase [Candidatus Woesearchaeota archaeon]|nr:Proline--tRNA ligase [Candidatus Woesearchaeota archaeon]